MKQRQPKNESQENILEFANPENIEVKLLYFSRSHRVLVLNIDSPDIHKDSVFIEFSELEFFSGTTSWTGANIQLQTIQEGLEFIENTIPRLWRIYEGFVESGFEHKFQYKLFTIPTKSGSLIQIIAANVAIRSKDNIKYDLE